MDSDTRESLVLRANDLVKRLLDQCHPHYGLSSVRNSVWDTAWVSMLRSKDGKSWAFPECFDFLLENQTSDGGWGNPYFNIEQICCTMAATLAMKKHLNDLHWNGRWGEINNHCNRAIEYIEKTLPSWGISNADDTLLAGIELWLPILLQQLEEAGVIFNVPGIDRINKMREKKLSKLPAKALYDADKLAAAYSLEGLVHLIDFDRIHHQKTVGSMCASPASTAVYLMHSSWDDEAEAYLRHVVNLCIGKEKRNLPHAFPTTTFETTWALLALLESGFCANDFCRDLRDKIITNLQALLNEHGGITGWSKGLVPDPDDTASTLSVLQLLGVPCSPDGLLKSFQGKDHFFTYPKERNPSPSVNGNVLVALLRLSNPSADYSSAIEKCVQYLCRRWWETDGLLDDKWNLSPFYMMMVISRAFFHYLIVLDRGHVKPLPDDLLYSRVPTVLVQCMMRTLLTQNSDGSWGYHKSKEETAYAIFTLQNVLSLPFTQHCRTACTDAIQRGRDFLRAGPDLPFSNHVWIAKMTNHMVMVTEAYLLGALNDPVRHEFSNTIRDLFDLPGEILVKQVNLYSRLPSFASVPQWTLEASAVEAHFLSLRMQDIDLLSQRAALGSAYLINFALSIVAVSNREKLFLSLGIGALDDIIRLAISTDHLDSHGGRDLTSKGSCFYKEYERVIFESFIDISVEYPRVVAADNRVDSPHLQDPSALGRDSVASAVKYLNSWLLGRPQVQRASQHDRTALLVEVRNMWLSNMFQVQYSTAFYDQFQASADDFAAAGYQFRRWAHATGGDSIFATIMVVFILCLASSGGGEDVLPTAIEKYLFQNWAHHVGVESRLRKDYLTWEQDRQRCNINSLDFAEFQSNEETGQRKDQLRQVIHYERDMANKCWRELEAIGSWSPKIMAALSYWRAVIDAVSEVHARRDVYESYAASGAEV